MTMLEFLVVLAGALLLDALVGDPPNRWHPVAWMGAFIRSVEGRHPRDRPGFARLGGTLTAVGGAALFSLPVLLLAHWSRSLGWVGLAIQAGLLKLTLSISGLSAAGARVRRALAAGRLAAARLALGRDLVSRPTVELSADEVASAAIESLAENLTDSVVAPLLAFSLGGLGAAWAYRFVNTADAMIGYQDDRYLHFGAAAARGDDILNWLPARMAGLLVTLASPAVGGGTRNAWRVMRSQHDVTASPNAGWPMAAAAGGLGVRLEKTGHYQLGRSSDLPGCADIGRAQKLVWIVALMSALISALIGGVIRAQV